MSFNLDILQARKVKFKLPRLIKIHLLGCGGTGSILISHILRALRLGLDLERYNNAELHIWDPDIVEEKNIHRQNFFPSDIGLPKVEALANRYGFHYGIPIVQHQTPFHEPKNIPHIIIGCMDDSMHGRLTVHKYYKTIKSDVRILPWWIDCGNAVRTGQVLIGNSLKSRYRNG